MLKEGVRMIRIWEFIKKRAWAVIGAIAGFFILIQKPKWVKEKEKEVKKRDQEIAEAQDESEDVYSTYEEVKANHDEAIKRAGEKKSVPSFTDPDDAAKYIDDILRKR